MILPLGDEPNPRGVPLVTCILIMVNCAIYLFITLPFSTTSPDLSDPALSEYLRVISENFPEQFPLSEFASHVSTYDLFIFNFGFRPINGNIFTLFTSMFLHAGFVHLAGNMLFLWIYGDNVEDKLGRIRFLLAYLITGAAATLFHTAFNPDSAMPLVGASGAISGILGFYFIWFPHNRVRLWVVLFPFFMNIIYAPARLVLGIYLILDNLMPFLITHGMQSTGVAYGAHLGGFLAGLTTAFAIKRRNISGRYVNHRTEPIPAPRTTAHTIASFIKDGSYENASTKYFSTPTEQTKRLLKPEQSIELGDWLAHNHHPKEALVIYQRHIRDYPIGPLLAEAHLGAALVQLSAFGQGTAAYQHLLEVLELHPNPETTTTALAALSAIEARKKS